MRRAALIVLVAILGCRGERTNPVPPRAETPTVAGRPLLAHAIAFERGDGVERDYRRAAGIYELLCRDGEGDVAACRRLIVAIGEARGVASKRDRLIELTTALCLASGDPQACAWAMFIWLGRDQPPTPQRAAIERKLADIDAEHFDERCAAGEPRACEGYLAVDAMFMGGNDEKRAAANRVLCRDDQVEACRSLVADLGACRAEADPEACTARTVDDWEQHHGDARLDALARLRRWCTAGDAKACAALPGQEIPRTALCDAHDYTACAELGCLGDEAADHLAAAHGAKANCASVAAHHPRTGVVAPGPARLQAGPPVPAIKPADRLPFDTLHFRQLGIRDQSGWPRFDVYNLGTRKVVGASVVFYAYDGSGNQIARSWPAMVSLPKLPPGGSARVEMNGHDSWFQAGPDPAVTYEVCYDAIRFERDSLLYRTRCPARKPRGARWGDGRARRVLGVEAMMPLGGHAPDAQTVHAFDERHAAAFEDTHPEVMIDVRERWPRRLTRSSPGLADLAASTAPAAEPRTVRVPVVLTPVAVVYRLDGIDELRLSPATLVEIFQGDIKVWNHPAITRDNPGVALPAVPITIRLAHSNWGDPFRRYLEQHAGPGWRGRSPQDWPAAVASWIPAQRADEVKGTNGTISHLELYAARAHGLQIARIKNRTGAFVAPSAAGATAAAAGATVGPDLGIDPLDAPGAAAYPLVYTTYAVVRPSTVDTATWPWITAYLTYLLTDAQATLAQDDLGALPAALAARAVAAVRAMPPQ